jgi:hypothetical protein
LLAPNLMGPLQLTDLHVNMLPQYAGTVVQFGTVQDSIGCEDSGVTDRENLVGRSTQGWVRTTGRRVTFAEYP